MSPQPRFHHHRYQVKLFEYNGGIMQVLRTIINSLDISFTHVYVYMHQEVGMHLTGDIKKSGQTLKNHIF